MEGILMYKKIQEDIKIAMKAKDSLTLNTLRLLIDSVQKKMLTLKANKEITDDFVIDCINKNIKQREESIEAYKKANRNDLVKIETNELNILKKYQPEPISEEDVKKAVVEIISKLDNTSSLGLVMKAVMLELKGKADGSLINMVVKEQLTEKK